MTNYCRFEFRPKHFGFNDCKQGSFYLPQWGRSKGWTVGFLVFRFFAFFFSLAWIIADVSIISQPRYWIYLTNWTEVTGCLYFLLALTLTLYGTIKRTKVKDIDNEDLKWFHNITWLVYTTAVNAALGTDLIFWALLSSRLPSYVLADPLNIHSHVINYVLLLIDLFLNDIPIRFLHFIYPVGYGLVYVIFTVILWASNFVPAVYPLLNWEQNPSEAVMWSLLSSLVLFPILHAFHFGLYHLRAWLARYFLHQRNRSQPPIDDQMEMGDQNFEANKRSTGETNEAFH